MPIDDVWRGGKNCDRWRANSRDRPRRSASACDACATSAGCLSASCRAPASRTPTSRGSRPARGARRSRPCGCSPRSSASRPITSRPARRSATPTSASFGSPTPSSSCGSPTNLVRPSRSSRRCATRRWPPATSVAASRANIALGLAAAAAGRNADAIERLEAGLELSPVSPSGRPDVFATLGRAYAATAPAGQGRRGVRALPRGGRARMRRRTSRAQVRFTTYLSYALTDLGDLERAQCGARHGARQGRRDDGRLLARAALLVPRPPRTTFRAARPPHSTTSAVRSRCSTSPTTRSTSRVPTCSAATS